MTYRKRKAFDEAMDFASKKRNLRKQGNALEQINATCWTANTVEQHQIRIGKHQKDLRQKSTGFYGSLLPSLRDLGVKGKRQFLPPGVQVCPYYLATASPRVLALFVIAIT